MNARRRSAYKFVTKGPGEGLDDALGGRLEDGRGLDDFGGLDGGLEDLGTLDGGAEDGGLAEVEGLDGGLDDAEGLALESLDTTPDGPSVEVTGSMLGKNDSLSGAGPAV